MFHFKLNNVLIYLFWLNLAGVGSVADQSTPTKRRKFDTDNNCNNTTTEKEKEKRLNKTNNPVNQAEGTPDSLPKNFQDCWTNTNNDRANHDDQDLDEIIDMIDEEAEREQDVADQMNFLLEKVVGELNEADNSDEKRYEKLLHGLRTVDGFETETWGKTVNFSSEAFYQEEQAPNKAELELSFQQFLNDGDDDDEDGDCQLETNEHDLSKNVNVGKSVPYDHFMVRNLDAMALDVLKDECEIQSSTAVNESDSSNSTNSVCSTDEKECYSECAEIPHSSSFGNNNPGIDLSKLPDEAITTGFVLDYVLGELDPTTVPTVPAISERGAEANSTTTGRSKHNDFSFVEELLGLDSIDETDPEPEPQPIETEVNLQSNTMGDVQAVFLTKHSKARGRGGGATETGAIPNVLNLGTESPLDSNKPSANDETISQNVDVLESKSKVQSSEASDTDDEVVVVADINQKSPIPELKISPPEAVAIGSQQDPTPVVPSPTQLMLARLKEAKVVLTRIDLKSPASSIASSTKTKANLPTSTVSKPSVDLTGFDGNAKSSRSPSSSSNASSSSRSSKRLEKAVTVPTETDKGTEVAVALTRSGKLSSSSTISLGLSEKISIPDTPISSSIVTAALVPLENEKLSQSSCSSDLLQTQKIESSGSIENAISIRTKRRKLDPEDIKSQLTRVVTEFKRLRSKQVEVSSTTSTKDALAAETRVDGTSSGNEVISDVTEDKPVLDISEQLKDVAPDRTDEKPYAQFTSSDDLSPVKKKRKVLPLPLLPDLPDASSLNSTSSHTRTCSAFRLRSRSTSLTDVNITDNATSMDCVSAPIEAKNSPTRTTQGQTASTQIPTTPNNSSNNIFNEVNDCATAAASAAPLINPSSFSLAGQAQPVNKPTKVQKKPFNIGGNAKTVVKKSLAGLSEKKLLSLMCEESAKDVPDLVLLSDIMTKTFKSRKRMIDTEVPTESIFMKYPALTIYQMVNTCFYFPVLLQFLIIL